MYSQTHPGQLAQRPEATVTRAVSEARVIQSVARCDVTRDDAVTTCPHLTRLVQLTVGVTMGYRGHVTARRHPHICRYKSREHTVTKRFFFFQVGGPMTKILVLRNKRVFKVLFIHWIGCEHDQDLGPPFSHVLKQVVHWSTYLGKKNAYCSQITLNATIRLRHNEIRIIRVDIMNFRYVNTSTNRSINKTLVVKT